MTPWQRLDPRMLLVGPVQALRQLAFPAILAVIGLSSGRGGVQWWAVPVVALGVLVMGAVPWLTTRFRIDAEQFQLRTGLVNRRVLTAPLDRVRSVDLESSLLHRLLGLTKVRVGTGVDESTIELNALGRAQADALQLALLARRAVGGPAAPLPDLDPDSPAPPPPPAPVAPEEVLATLDWSWLRFAPLNLARLAVVAGAVGALSQLVNDVPVLTQDRVRSAGDSLAGLGWPLLVAAVLVLVLLAWTVLSTAGYALQWAGLRLVRGAGTLRLTAGLLTTRSVSIEESRIRGVELVEPALMRAVGGGELRALATGVSGGTTPVLPPSPLAENQRVGAALLETPEPLTTALVSHGPRARRRAHVRHQLWTLELTALAALLTWWRDWPLWAPVVVVVVLAPLQLLAAELEWRHRGHALTSAHLVSGSGALARRRTVLERDGVIGWVVRQTYFQRRAGLATLVATTAAGEERVEIVDVPHDLAVSVAAQVTPGAVGDFLRRA